MTQKRKQLSRMFKDNNAILILFLILIGGLLLVPGYGKSFYNVIYYASIYGLVCLGLGLIMITGEIDLSAGFQAASAGVFGVLAFNAVYGATGNELLSLIACIAGSVISGGILGTLNGYIVTKIGVPSLIATIAVNYAYQGIVYYFAQSSFAPASPDIVKSIAKTKIFGLKWLTPSVIIFVVIVALVFLWMYKTKFGNRLHVVGDNPEAAAFAGINVSSTKWVTYIISGVLAGLCGFLMVSSDGFAIYTQGTSLATFTISCCVVGGIKMTGGKGTAFHVLIGVLIMRAISQIMVCKFLASAWVNFITGCLLIVVLLIDRFTSNKSVDD